MTRRPAIVEDLTGGGPGLRPDLWEKLEDRLRTGKLTWWLVIRVVPNRRGESPPNPYYLCDRMFADDHPARASLDLGGLGCTLGYRLEVALDDPRDSFADPRRTVSVATINKLGKEITKKYGLEPFVDHVGLWCQVSPGSVPKLKPGEEDPDAEE